MSARTCRITAAAVLLSWYTVILLSFGPQLTSNRPTKECSCGYGGLCINSDENGNRVEPQCNLCRNVSGGFYGPDCQTIVNYCDSNPCQRGTCVPTFGSYFCKCPPFYVGQRCEFTQKIFADLSYSAAIYVYYQVQTGRKGKRTPFHLIFDPGEQVGIMKSKENGIKVSIAIDDGRHLFPMRRYQFSLKNVRRECEENARNDSEIFDIRVCNYLPAGDAWTFSFDPQFHTFANLDAVFLPVGKNDEKRKVGVAGNVEIRIEWFFQGRPRLTLFQQTYKLFTYLMSNVVHHCFPKIEFKSCSLKKEFPRLKLRKDAIRVSQIAERPPSCDGLRAVGYSWFVQRDTGFHGVYDPVPTELKEFHSATFIEFPKMFFTDGVHMIEYRLDLRGDPPIHGGQTASVIYSRCWIKIELGQIDVQVKGGNVRTMPCYASLELTFHSFNPCYELADMDFIISCDVEDDEECAKRQTEVPAIRKLVTPCDTIYRYSVEVIHLISKRTYQNISVEVNFVSTDVVVTVDCSFNCFPVDPSHRMIAVATIEPFTTDTVTWNVTADQKVITEREPEVEAFFPLSASRILRVDGALFATENRRTDVAVEVTTTKASLRAAIHSKSNNLKQYINKFQIEQISDGEPIYRFIASEEPNFPYGPVLYRVVQTNPKLRDSLQLVESNYLEELVFQPEWRRIQLCIDDAADVEACSEQHIVNDTVKSEHTLAEMVKIFDTGDVDKFLHTAAIWLYHGLVQEKIANFQFEWKIGILERHIILRYALHSEHVEQSSIQATTHLLSMIFYSEIGNQNENLGEFVEDDVLKNTSFPDLVGWANMRYSGLLVLLRITDWMSERTQKEIKFTKLIYGDILDCLMRTWSLAHVQGYLLTHAAVQYAKRSGFEQWEGYLVKLSKEDTSLLMKIIYRFAQTLAQSSRLFYGIRDVGTKHARAWTMRTTYQGILASFNRSRVSETLPGYSNHVFGPIHSGNEWVELVNISLPDAKHVGSLFGRELCFTVFAIGSRPGDPQVSPTVLIDMRDVRGTVYSELPGGREYYVTLPVMIDGKLANSSKSFFYQSALVPPSNPQDDFQKYNVYKYALPSVFERWELILHLNKSVHVRVKVSYDGVPMYEEVEKEKILPLKLDESTAQFSGEITLLPKKGKAVLPDTFYIGIMLADPGVVKKSKKDNLINCLCGVLGFVTAVPKFARVSQVTMREIKLDIPAESKIWPFVLPTVLTVIVLLTLLIACVADFRRNRKDVLIYMEDTYPQDKNLLVIGVYTGKNLLAGSVSTVAIKVVGLNSSSRVHLLKSKKQRTLKTAFDDWFVLTTKEPLGKIKSIYLWHNYRKLSNWYCSHVLIYDIKQGTWYMAKVERWFKLYPIVDESRMTVVQTWKLSTLEAGLRAMPNQFRNHYIVETRNSHPVASLFCLHTRSLSSHEQKSLIFLLKCFAMGFWSWFALEYVSTWIYNYYLDPDDVEERFGFNLNTVVTSLFMALGSYVFTTPYNSIIKSTHSSRLIQKRTTNPMVLEVAVPDHVAKPATKEKEKSLTSGDSKQKSVMFQLGPKDNLVETQSMTSKTEPNRDSKSSVKVKKAAHQSIWKRFIRIAFGPCQFRCVNISHQTFELRMRKRVICARVLAAILLLGCSVLIVRFEMMTYLWTKSNVCLFLLALALLLDSFVISPIIIFFSSILSLVYLQTSNQEIYMWHEDTKITVPTPLTLNEYISIATGKDYKPLLSKEIEVNKFLSSDLSSVTNQSLQFISNKTTIPKVEEKSLVYSFFRSLALNVCIIAVVLVNVMLLADRHGVIAYHTTRTLITAYNEGSLSPLDELSPRDVHLNSVENVKLPSQVETFVSLNVADLPSRWPNKKSISTDQKRWGKDLTSKVLGATSLLICFVSSTGMKMKIARLFTPYFKEGEGFLTEAGLEDKPVFLDENLLEFKQLDKSLFTIHGDSGEVYNLHGHQAVMSAKDWSKYYVMLDSFLQEIIRRKSHVPTPRALVLTTNFLNMYTRRVITVDFLAEFLPSGVSSAKLLVNNSVAYSRNYNVAVAIRFVLVTLVAVLLVVNVMEMSKIGTRKYAGELRGFTKLVVFVAGVLVVASTFQCYFPKYARIDTLFRRTIEIHTDVHRVHTWELIDSLAMSLLVLAICSELTIVVRNAFGAVLLKQATTEGCRIVLTACLLLIFFSRAVEICFVADRPLKFVLFVELQFRLEELPQFRYLTILAQTATVFILIGAKVCTAMNIHYFLRTKPSVDTKRVKTLHILKRYCPKRKPRDSPSKPDAVAAKKSLSIRSTSTSSGEQKIETRSERLWSKVQSMSNIWGSESE